MQCEDSQNCLVKECALGQDLCRTTVLHEWEDDNELELEMRDCAHYEKTNRTMSYRVNSKIISLAEVVCATDVCNRPRPVLNLRDLPPNGVQCYSCEGNSTHGCSSKETSLIDCRGPMDQCLEATGLDGEALLELEGDPLGHSALPRLIGRWAGPNPGGPSYGKVEGQIAIRGFGPVKPTMTHLVTP
ncbi:urokinase plasminogen activator surface receptor [Cricetulus griseus]|uniref:Urokinase plasminogen activator surface receptor n=1 Tax=Cricetulus griseus TaxID=10029 RepID=A0A061HV01_CRIGR|nr:urokinase plasminogen activator surface receptor [Cricetulus griseus]